MNVVFRENKNRLISVKSEKKKKKSIKTSWATAAVLYRFTYSSFAKSNNPSKDESNPVQFFRNIWVWRPIEFLTDKMLILPNS